nr:DASH complex subunit DAD3 [Cryptococcus depauperatus CBS 7841]
MSLNTTNPYANNSQLTSTEKDVLWEYAKLSDKIKRAASLARETTKSPNESLLDELRVLEKRMGLVLTLVQASVWAFIVDTQAAGDSQQQQQPPESDDSIMR